MRPCQRRRNYVGLLVLGFFISISAQAQVYLRLALDADGMTYKVYMRSTTAYSGRQALLSTAQVTLAVPHGTGSNRFEVTDLTSPIASMHWLQKDRVDAPIEEPLKDYLFFSFINNSNPLVAFDIAANTDILLFQFKRKGNCLGRAELLDNQTDPFRTPNSKGINVGNSVSLLATSGNAYLGNLDKLPSLTLKATELICVGQPVELLAVVSGSEPLATYQWFVNGKSISGPSGSPRFTYYFPSGLAGNWVDIQVVGTLKGSSACDERSVTAHEKRFVKPVPAATLSVKGDTCAELPMTLDTPFIPQASYQWYADTLPISRANQAAYAVKQSGNYSVKVTIEGCSNSSRTIALIGIKAADRIEISAPASQTLIAGMAVPMNARVSNANSYHWLPASGLSSPTIENPVANPTQTTTYTLTAQNDSGCVVSDTIQLFVMPGLYMPSAFSPNNDGVNDSWLIENLEYYPTSQVTIVNRWGVIIYSQRDYHNAPWNVQNQGREIDSGIYYYSIRTPFSYQTGTITAIK
ncbi:gliding motility-associated C-terminal domain-containing protein [Spirosoma sp. 48-14]|uniref:gliding motility-associated C-terminal domain-containing protein n=1 Tax=Spirosoma sp. 48-14 TaxID=1895854 RepID=UPI00095D0312|nr:gliding motility-associated C-terminal domain-containing protein [Spirosoma sp. 48-14]OJW75645.1 MAG: hypothetical protein BGO59_08720 [Spirosoma sp. 48-14]